jgi:hypothetical protein
VRNRTVAVLLIVSIVVGASMGYLVGVSNQPATASSSQTSITGTPIYHLYVSAQPDNLTISANPFHYTIVLTNPNDVEITYMPHVEVEMMPTQENSIVYSRAIEFNMTFPLTLNPHETRVIYNGEIPLTTSNGTYWLQVLGQSTAGVVVLSEPTLVTVKIA